MQLLRVLLCLLHLAMASKAADECAALQVKNVAESQADPKKRVDDTLLPNITTDFLQDGKDLQGNEGIPFKIWKIKKIKEALEGRRHPAGTTTTTSTTTDLCLLSSIPDCPSGDFTFAFENLNETENGNSPGRVTGCISGLSCGDTDFQAATSVRVVSNTAGYGLGEYLGNTGSEINLWSVSATCEIESFFFFNVGAFAPADGSMSLFDGGSSGVRCAALSTNSTRVVPVCSCETKLTFKYNNP
mmetsp:Transcript_22523/g.49311  ORF Transcript_22523/g.49311 Transcript_22523/m.49311 type:complete len:244 (-) Transcript_22523:28-759(-)